MTRKGMRAWGEARGECMRELAGALFYMDHLYPQPRSGRWSWQPQRGRVMKLVAKLEGMERADHKIRIARAGKARNRMSSAKWWRDFLKEIVSETENMC
jgi:hypothetical protein